MKRSISGFESLSGKVKYAVEDRIKRASRAVNMLQGALSTCGNVNVNVAMSLFEKQMVPMLIMAVYFGVFQVAIIECILIIYQNLSILLIKS